MADLGLRAGLGRRRGDPAAHDLVIFDEAHELEDAAADGSACGSSQLVLARFARDVDRAAAAARRDPPEHRPRSAAAARRAPVRRAAGGGRVRLRRADLRAPARRRRRRHARPRCAGIARRLRGGGRGGRLARAPRRPPGLRARGGASTRRRRRRRSSGRSATGRGRGAAHGAGRRRPAARGAAVRRRAVGRAVSRPRSPSAATSRARPPAPRHPQRRASWSLDSPFDHARAGAASTCRAMRPTRAAPAGMRVADEMRRLVLASARARAAACSRRRARARRGAPPARARPAVPRAAPGRRARASGCWSASGAEVDSVLFAIRELLAGRRRARRGAVAGRARQAAVRRRPTSRSWQRALRARRARRRLRLRRRLLPRAALLLKQGYGRLLRTRGRPRRGGGARRPAAHARATAASCWPPCRRRGVVAESRRPCEVPRWRYLRALARPPANLAAR